MEEVQTAPSASGIPLTCAVSLGKSLKIRFPGISKEHATFSKVSSMTRWFVSRHPGAVEWATRRKLAVDQFVPHLNARDVQGGDLVYGTLPVELAAEVCRRGARFFALCCSMAEEHRGRDLSAEELFRLNARLREYHVVALEHDHDACH